MTSLRGWSRLVVSAILVATLVGCATRTYQLVGLRVGMTREEVQKAIGRPSAVRLGGTRTGSGQKIEIWEYHLYDRSNDKGLSALLAIGRANTNYWLYFEDDKLFRWGPAGERPVVPVR